MKKSNLLRQIHFYLFFYLYGVPNSQITAQTIPELETQLAAATSEPEKAKIFANLASAWAKKEPSKARDFAEQAVLLSEKSNLPDIALLALNLKGDACIRLNDFDCAKNAYNLAFEKMPATADSMLIGRTLHNLGKYFQTVSNKIKAIEFYEKAYFIREKIGDKAGLGGTCLNLGALFYDKYDYQRSNFYYQNALRLKTEAGDKAGIASVLTNMSSNNIALNNHQAAIPDLIKAVEINLEIDNQVGLSGCYQKLSAVYDKLGNNEEAEVWVLKEIEQTQKMKNDFGLCLARGNYGQFLLKKGELLAAADQFYAALEVSEGMTADQTLPIFRGLADVKFYQNLFSEQLAIYEKIDTAGLRYDNRASLFGAQAGAYNSLNCPDLGKIYAEKAIYFAKKAKSIDLEAGALQILAKSYLQIKRPEEALVSIDKALALHRNLTQSERKGALLNLKSEILSEAGVKNKQALETALQALELNKKQGDLLMIKYSYEQIAEAYRLLGNADEAMEARQLAQNIQDSMLSPKQIRGVAFAEKDFEFEQKQKLMQAEALQKEAVIAAKMDQQNQKQTLILLGFALFLLVLGLLFWVWRSNQKIKALEIQEKTRQKIARDLHDEVGSTLSTISFLSEAAKRNSPEISEKSKFDNIGEKARSAMDSMSDIVWAVNPQNDSMPKILERLTLFATETLENAGIMPRFSIDESLSALHLPMEKRKEFYLLFKEAVSNCAKHSRAKNAKILLEKSNEHLVFQLEDDGIGFEKGTSKGLKTSEGFQTLPTLGTYGGNGMKNMTERAKLLNGELVIRNLPENGASVYLRFPLG